MAGLNVKQRNRQYSKSINEEMSILTVMRNRGLKKKKKMGKLKNSASQYQNTSPISCGKCEKENSPKQFSAYGKTVGKCHRPRHFASMCRCKTWDVSEISAKESDNSSYYYLLETDAII